MSHKAFAFDWRAFELDPLHAVLLSALQTNSTIELQKYIDEWRATIKNPYDGLPLAHGWRGGLEYGDVHELGDVALTRFYQPDADFGLGEQWGEAEARLLGAERDRFLGSPIGRDGLLFDPGRQGAYFHASGDVNDFLCLVTKLDTGDGLFSHFKESLRCCPTLGLGLYQTF
jgi:hypothetical protein